MSDRDTEAAHWFARMRTPGAEADRGDFDAWHSDPENAEAYANAKEDWLITGGVAEEHLAAHRQVPSKATTPSRAHWALAAALVADGGPQSRATGRTLIAQIDAGCGP